MVKVKESRILYVKDRESFCTTYKKISKYTRTAVHTNNSP